MAIYNESIAYNAAGIQYNQGAYVATGSGSISIVGTGSSALTFATTGSGSISLVASASYLAQVQSALQD